MKPVSRILIVGGGTAGWLSAAYLSRKLGSGQPGGPEITLIEASDIPTIGVGEATIPPIRTMVQMAGFDEAEFMREASATFKLGIRFDDWLQLPDEGKPEKRHSYYHAFGPHGTVNGELLAPYWVMDRERSGRSFVNYTMMEGAICDAYRGPKRINDHPFQGPVEYAYHFDAGRLAEALKTKGNCARCPTFDWKS